MKIISDCIKIDNLSIAREEKTNQMLINPLAVKLVDYIFAKFFLLCRGCDSLYNDPKRLLAEKTQWQSTFTREGYVSIEKIKHGLLRLEKHTYALPPQLGEFLKWCKPTPEDLNLLSKERAYKRAFEIMRNGNPTDLSDDQIMIIRLATQETGSHFMKNNSEAKTQPVFYRNYEILVRDFIAGNLKPIPKGLENKAVEEGELKKQQQSSKGFEDLNSYEKAMPEIFNILVMRTHGTVNKQ